MMTVVTSRVMMTPERGRDDQACVKLIDGSSNDH